MFFLKYFFRAFIPIQKAIVMFDSFGGQFSDNPKYVALKLHEIAPDVKIYFVVSEKHSKRDAMPNYMIPLLFGSREYKILEHSCHVFISNGLFSKKVSFGLRFSMFCSSIFKGAKLIISTWHGTPLKKIGLDDSKSQLSQTTERKIFADYVIAGCRHTASVLSTFSQRDPFPISMSGTPRCDILLSDDVDIASLKEKLRLPNDKKIILFAPTFRDDIYESGIHQMESLDIPKILRACSQRLGGEWVFVYRLHYEVSLTINKSLRNAPQIVDGNIGDDMMEYLACADILLTDYSSSMFDFALTGKPCFLFALDREHYEKQERGFYLDYDALPFPFADTSEGLIEKIRTFDNESYRKGVAKLLDDLGNVEDGKASERIAKCIAHFIRTGEKRLKTVYDADD